MSVDHPKRTCSDLLLGGAIPGFGREWKVRLPNMFRWLNNQGVESDAGFAVQFTGRFTVQYREGDRAISVECESGGVTDGFRKEHVWSDAFDSWIEEGSVLAEADREKARLFKNLSEAFSFQGLKLVVDRRPK